jgi:hypothetical protein
VVAKRLDQHYRAGGRTWRKIRTRLTAEAVVGGVLGSIARPEALIVGRYDARGRLRVAGRTTALPRPARAELGRLLTMPASGTHPWPVTIPSSRFGQRPSEPINYVQVAPTAVVELDVDTSFEQDRGRHATRYVRLPADLHHGDVPGPRLTGLGGTGRWRHDMLPPDRQLVAGPARTARPPSTSGYRCLCWSTPKDLDLTPIWRPPARQQVAVLALAAGLLVAVLNVPVGVPNAVARVLTAQLMRDANKLHF